MGKLLLFIIIGFTSFVSFLASGTLSPSFAANVGETCVIDNEDHANEITCTSGSVCNVNGCTGRRCTGFCDGNPTNVPNNGACVATSTNLSGGCQAGLVCNTNSCDPDKKHCPGICRQNTAQLGEVCTSSSSVGGAGAAQGTCKAGLVCNTANSPSCNSTTGGCQGVCFAQTYSCDALDSRTGITVQACPNGFSCVESQNKPKIRDCNGSSTTGVYQQSEVCTESCPGCIFTCAPTSQVKINCTCDNPETKSAGSGRNGFLCTNALGQEHGFCNASEKGCYNTPGATMTDSSVFNGQKLNGIECETPIKKNPPAPPCQKFVNGKCAEIITAFGTVGTDPGEFIIKVFSILLGAAGSIGLLLFSRAGYRIMTSRGNQEAIKEGREQLVAAIVGLIFLIFSFVFLQIIGVDLLKLPNFSGTGGASCDVAGNAPQCPAGRTCVPTGAGRSGTCQ